MAIEMIHESDTLNRGREKINNNFNELKESYSSEIDKTARATINGIRKEYESKIKKMESSLNNKYTVLETRIVGTQHATIDVRKKMEKELNEIPKRIKEAQANVTKEIKKSLNEYKEQISLEVRQDVRSNTRAIALLTGRVTALEKKVNNPGAGGPGLPGTY